MAKTGHEIATRRLTLASNEWMRRYTEDPANFSRDWQEAFRAEQALGKTPSYGAQATAYLESILDGIPFEANEVTV